MAMARQSCTPTILLTRPLRQSRRFAAALGEGGDRRIVISPLMAPHFLHPVLPDMAFSALILTSETGAEAAAALQVPLPARAYCVGDHTAAVAKSLGFEPLSAQGDAVALAAFVRARNEAGPLLYLRGKEVRGGLAEMLSAGGIVTHSAVVYDQRPHPLTAEAEALIDQGVPLIVPLFSPRSARLFITALAGRRNGPLWLAALSPAVAAELQGLGADGLETAQSPDAGAMRLAVERLIASACGP